MLLVSLALLFLWALVYFGLQIAELWLPIAPRTEASQTL